MSFIEQPVEGGAKADLGGVFAGPGLATILRPAGWEAGTDAFGLQTDTFRQKRFFTSLNGSRKRNRFNVAAFWEERKTDGTGTDDTVYGIAGNLSRTLSRRTTGSVRLTYRRTKFEGGEDRTDDFYAVTGNLSYQIFRNTSAVLSYSYTQRDSDADANDVTENAVVLRLRREF